MYPNWILQRAYLTPLRCALTYEGQTWTFQELNELSMKRARQLTALGVKQKTELLSWGRAHLGLL